MNMSRIFGNFFTSGQEKNSSLSIWLIIRGIQEKSALEEGTEVPQL
jgi:hypothetical protein